MPDDRFALPFRSVCPCGCHTRVGVLHIAPCCRPDPIDLALDNPRIADSLSPMTCAPISGDVPIKDTGKYFEERGPIGHVGRRSIPRSHRGEGFNYVD